MNYKETAKGILEHVGGVENISNMSHCATRLRLNLKDETLANDEDVKAVDGVVNVINKAGQYQVLIVLRLMVLLMSSIKQDNIKCLLSCG